MVRCHQRAINLALEDTCLTDASCQYAGDDDSRSSNPEEYDRSNSGRDDDDDRYDDDDDDTREDDDEDDDPELELSVSVLPSLGLVLFVG